MLQTMVLFTKTMARTSLSSPSWPAEQDAGHEVPTERTYPDDSSRLSMVDKDILAEHCMSVAGQSYNS